MNMNKFEQALQNVPYSTDWYEYRNNHLNVVGQFLQSEDCKWYQVWETDNFKDIKFHCIVFFIYDLLYVWTDTVENGLIEASQLDRPVNDYTATVLYSNVENSAPFAPVLFKMIDNEEIKRIQ